MFGTNILGCCVSFEQEGRRSLEHAIHLCMYLCDCHFPDLFFKFVDFDAAIGVNLDNENDAWRVSSSSLSLCFSMFMYIPAMSMFLARSNSASEMGSLNNAISRSATLTTSSAWSMARVRLRGSQLR